MQAAGGTPIAGIGRTGTGVRRLRLLFGATAVGGWLTDVVTKIAAVRWLEPGHSVPVVDGLLQLRLVRNPGAAFSLGEGVTPVFAVLSTAVLVFVVARLAPRIGHPGWAVGLGLLCAGVAGNLVDRLFRWPGVLRGHVVDFLALPHWPVFNVADMCICAAAVMILALSVVRNVAINGERHVEPAGARSEDRAAR